MQFTEEYIRQVIKEEYEALIDEKKKKPCKPAKGKRFAKRVNGKCRSYGQSGQSQGWWRSYSTRHKPRVMPTAHDPQRSRNVRTHLAPTHYPERSGSVAALSQ